MRRAAWQRDAAGCPDARSGHPAKKNGYATRQATAAQRRADNKSEETDGRVLPLNYPAIVQQGQDSNLRHDPGML